MRYRDLIKEGTSKPLMLRDPYNNKSPEVPVYENPLVSVLLRLVTPNPARGIINENGQLFVWNGDLVHSDVRQQLEDSNWLSLFLYKDEITVWGVQEDDGEPFDEPHWISIIISNPSIHRFYKGGIKITYEHWF